METLTTTISIILLLGLVSFPIVLFLGITKWYKLHYPFVVYLISGLLFTTAILLTFAWWADFSNKLLLDHYGYDFDALNETERFQNVESTRIERVKQLELAHFGMGWPLKALIASIFYTPYFFMVYLIGHLIITKRKNKNQESENAFFT